MKVTKLADHKEAKANELLKPVYLEISDIKERLRLKIIELQRMEVELLGEDKAESRRLSRKNSKIGW